MIIPIWAIAIAVLILVYILASIKVINEYERGVKFTLGKYQGIIEPGIKMIWPFIQTWRRIDIRTKAVDVPDQEAITRDNVSAKVNAVIYYKIKATETQKVVIQVEDFKYAVSQLAQTTMRNVVGETTLDELLVNRDEVAAKIRNIIDKATDPWGIDVESVELKDINLPGEMVRVMAKQAEAEREKRAVIIKAEGEVAAASNMSKAAKTLSSSNGALHLRTLQSINDISSDKSNTIIFAVPIEVLKAFEGWSKKIMKK